jgi:hypothetical protein
MLDTHLIVTPILVMLTFSFLDQYGILSGEESSKLPYFLLYSSFPWPLCLLSVFIFLLIFLISWLIYYSLLLLILVRDFEMICLNNAGNCWIWIFRADFWSYSLTLIGTYFPNHCILWQMLLGFCHFKNLFVEYFISYVK